jgi:hypothetical protein
MIFADTITSLKIDQVKKGLKLQQAILKHKIYLLGWKWKTELSIRTNLFQQYKFITSSMLIK